LTLLSDVNTPLIPLIGYVVEAAINPGAAKLDIKVEAGKTYYIKMHPETHFTHFTPHLNLVTKGIGENEIAACQLILPADN